MEFGVFHEFPHRTGRTDAEIFAEGFELVDAAERWGLDVMWLAELHFSPTRSVLAAPLTIASAIAARTERMKIGTAVQVLPLADPLRLAEEAEALEVITKAWTEPVFSHQGTYHRYENVSVMPRPYQQPHPPIRVAATSADTYPAIGAQGYPLFVAVRLGTFSELVPAIQAYRAAYRAGGHPGEGQVFLRVPMYLGETADQAIAEPEDSIMQFFRGFAAQVAASATEAGARPVEQRAERGQRLQALTYADVRRDKAIVGTPELVGDRLRELQQELGLNGILAEPNCGGLIPHERVLRSVHLLCDRVMPQFK
jgi:alkanesulfonate monooxygenase SsuD/methylene tetrahydromethanopterin reductase-like flavin-dependent oxidoreductase (luciferase family)